MSAATRSTFEVARQMSGHADTISSNAFFCQIFFFGSLCLESTRSPPKLETAMCGPFGQTCDLIPSFYFSFFSAFFPPKA